MSENLRPARPGVIADSAARSHFNSEIDLPRGFAGRLASVCPQVSELEADLADAGRDWWPIGVSWIQSGEVPARAGLLASPEDASQVAQILQLCSTEGVPVTPLAGRSGVCGGSIPLHGGVALDMKLMKGILEVSDQDLLVDVAPGTWGDDFEADLQSQHGLTVGHWPQSMEISTVGGWVACRGAGQYSTRYGKIEDLTAGIQVALADGRVIEVGHRAPRSSTGPDLLGLFLGSEGTLGAITRVTLSARPRPSERMTRAWSFGSMMEGLEACRLILRAGGRPAVLRLYDRVETSRHFRGIEGCALVLLDEDHPLLLDATARLVDSICAPVGVAQDPLIVEHWFETRNRVADLDQLYSAGLVADTIEIAAPWSGLGSIYQEVVEAVGALQETVAVSAHQSHAYTTGACIYFSFAGRTEQAETYYRRVWDLVMESAAAHRGALSHHHGVGLNRRRHLKAADPTSGVLEALKAHLDPAGVLNPGKLGLSDPFETSPQLDSWGFLR